MFTYPDFLCCSSRFLEVSDLRIHDWVAKRFSLWSESYPILIPASNFISQILGEVQNDYYKELKLKASSHVGLHVPFQQGSFKTRYNINTVYVLSRQKKPDIVYKTEANLSMLSFLNDDWSLFQQQTSHTLFIICSSHKEANQNT